MLADFCSSGRMVDKANFTLGCIDLERLPLCMSGLRRRLRFWNLSSHLSFGFDVATKVGEGQGEGEEAVCLFVVILKCH